MDNIIYKDIFTLLNEEFVNHINSKSYTIIEDNTLSSLFSYNILKLLNNKFNNVIQLDVENLSINDFDIFLFNNSIFNIDNNVKIFFIKNISIVDKNIKKLWFNKIFNYNGIHKLILIVNELDLNNSNVKFDVYKIDKKINKVSCKKLYQFFSGKYIIKYMDYIYDIKDFYNIDELLILMNYQYLVKNYDKDLTIFLNKLIFNKQSLFTLSSYFFALDKYNFFNYIEFIKYDYTPEFWLSYWADQIWQAIVYIDNIKNGKFSNSKIDFKGLPFSFFNKDFKIYIDNFLLENSYIFISNIVKNINSDINYNYLDLFYYKFFNKII